MAHFELLAPARGAHRASVIFFHGLGGNARETWTSANSTVWPNWLAEDIDGLSIYLVGYEAPMSKWQGRGRGMHPVDHANAILERLYIEPGLASGDLYLVGHSLGGIIIKMMMRRAELNGRRSDVAKSFLRRVRKVAFLATPHTGADLGQIAILLRKLTRPSPATESLARNDPDLRALNEDYRKIAQDREVQHLILSEREELILRRKFMGAPMPPINLGVIVKPDNADPGVNVDPIPISVDHVQIAKPKDREDEIYRHMRAFLQRPTTPPQRNDFADAETGQPLARFRGDGTSQRIEAQNFDISRIDSYAPEKLIGRETETKIIDEAWAAAVRGDAKRPRILTFVAMGGEGKTSLVADWAVRKQIDGWRQCDAAFAWSFYSQGTRDQYAGDSDLFLAEALKFFGVEAKEGEGAVEKAKRLARLIGEKRALLILDGLEPLQYPPTWSPSGELKDDAMAALLKALAANSKGLCLVTTRYSIPNLKAYRDASAPEVDLKRLPKQAGAHLLKMLGVVGTQNEREELSEDAKGHALTLTLIGGYLRDAHGGDIRKRDLFNLGEADEEEQGGHAFRAMAAYVRWFEEDKGGRRALAMLRLMGLFDRPADFGCLRALWRGPAIKGVTESIVGLSEAHRNIAIKRLEDAKLLTVNREAGGALVSLDAHPLLREHFAKELREKNPEGWKAAHKRLYQHLCATETDKKDAPTLDDLRPLYQAVAHGCHAGLQQEALYNVYVERIERGTGPGGFYSTRKLGAFGADLGAVACFFDAPWTLLSPNLSPPDRAWLLNQAALRLRALGRLREALEPMRAGLAMRVEQENWKNAAISASNISELALMLGDVAAAARVGAESVNHADRSGDEFWRMISRTTHADALHQRGAFDEAQALFDDAEAMQKEWQPAHPLLYSVQGFRYCDFLLGPSERAAWRLLVQPAIGEQGSLPGGARSSDGDMDRAPPGAQNAPPSLREGSMRSRVYPTSQNNGKAIQSGGAVSGLLRSARNDDAETLVSLLDAWADVEKRAEQIRTWGSAAKEVSLLDIALYTLPCARAALYAAMLRGEAPDGAHVDAAVTALRDAGQKQFQPLGLLTRALYRAVAGDFPGAQDDLVDAFDIAERGPMKLFLADIHLHRARLFGLYAKRPDKYPWESPADDLAEARRLIEECGYWRRKEELEDAEAALRELELLHR